MRLFRRIPGVGEREHSQHDKSRNVELLQEVISAEGKNGKTTLNSKFHVGIVQSGGAWR
jgi:hypothetical protein